MKKIILFCGLLFSAYTATAEESVSVYGQVTVPDGAIFRLYLDDLGTHHLVDSAIAVNGAFFLEYPAQEIVTLCVTCDAEEIFGTLSGIWAEPGTSIPIYPDKFSKTNGKYLASWEIHGPSSEQYEQNTYKSTFYRRCAEIAELTWIDKELEQELPSANAPAAIQEIEIQREVIQEQLDSIQYIIYDDILNTIDRRLDWMDRINADLEEDEEPEEPSIVMVEELRVISTAIEGNSKFEDLKPLVIKQYERLTPELKQSARGMRIRAALLDE